MTAKQDAALKAFCDLTTVRGPTAAELQESLGLGSRSAAYRYVRALVDDGLLERIDQATHMPRGYRPTQDGWRRYFALEREETA